jgi:transglutaminase-like putative cysteine protease
MVYRFSWLAGTAAILLALTRLNRLMRSSVEGVPWQIILLAAAVLGAIITWTGLAYRLHLGVVAAINVVALGVTVVRVAAPDTAIVVIPTADSVDALRTDIGYAADLIQSSVAPVIPATGLIVILTAVFWTLGAVLVWGLQRGHPFIALVPALAFYLQLATVDRGGSRLAWMASFLLLGGLSLAAVTHDERTAGVGRLGGETSSPLLPGWSFGIIGVVVIVAIGAATMFGSAVPASGSLRWRQSSGLTGDFFGGISFNPFVSVQKQLVSQTNTPVFAARVSGDIDPGELYWNLLTMDSFNGVWWFAESPMLNVPDQLETLEDPDHAFAGPTGEVVQDVTILALQSEWLPTAYSPQALDAPTKEVDQGFRAAEDGSLRFGALTFRGMNYRVRSEVPQPDITLLALNEEGTPSNAFATAIEEGEVDAAVFDTTESVEVREEPRDVDTYRRLPDDFDPAIQSLAVTITRGLDSDYEKALALETWLRDPENGFRYDTNVSAASQDNTLSSWLLDENSSDYRSGYCEQYASALGAMGRAIGLPARVVLGFTPGDVQSDGTIIVRDNNAHAWVEFWMPSQGWVRFDATPRADYNIATAETLPFDITPFLEVPELDPLSVEAAPLPLVQLAEEPDDRFIGVGGDGESTGISLPPLVSWIPAIIIGGLVAVFIPLFKARRRKLRLGRLHTGDIGAAWKEITQRLSDLGATPDPSKTAAEIAAETDASMEPLATVYAESVYGPIATLAPERIEVAEQSFADTERALEGRYSPGQRLLARYRLRSLMPRHRKRR